MVDMQDQRVENDITVTDPSVWVLVRMILLSKFEVRLPHLPLFVTTHEHVVYVCVREGGESRMFFW